jgi:hypothetical protein
MKTDVSFEIVRFSKKYFDLGISNFFVFCLMEAPGTFYLDFDMSSMITGLLQKAIFHLAHQHHARDHHPILDEI